MTLPAMQLFFQGYNVRSSLVASRARHDEMLHFAATHGVKPWIEEFPLSEEGMSEAVAKLKANKVRYRGVLVAKS
jgi:D-arabinose 1-dehydrogenase-like Zn-dependent alcohol dehydrogenase